MKRRLLLPAIAAAASLSLFAALAVGLRADPDALLLWGGLAASTVSAVCLLAAVLTLRVTPSERYAELHPSEEDDDGISGR